MTAAAALQAALETGASDPVARLLQLRADPNLQMPNGETPLGMASATGSVGAAAALLSYGANVGDANTVGQTPLHRAAAAGHTALLQLLLSAGATPTAHDGSGRAALDHASTADARELLQRAQEQEAEPEPAEENADEENPTLGPVSPAGPASPEASDAGATPQSPGAIEEAGPPPYPSMTLGEPAVAPDALDAPTLLAELRRALGSNETEAKRMLMYGSLKPRALHCDVVRAGNSGSVYRCYARLHDSSAQRVCIFEATRARKGKLANAHYLISVPADPRLSSSGTRAPEYCGKTRSFHLSGAVFVVYDDGAKPGSRPPRAEEAPTPRQQLAAIAFSKGHSRRSPMTMRALLSIGTPREHDPEGSAEPPDDAANILQALDSLDPQAVTPPAGTELLTLMPPLWNEQTGMFQLAFEARRDRVPRSRAGSVITRTRRSQGRACCMSNKNVQLVSSRYKTRPTLQVQIPEISATALGIHSAAPFGVRSAIIWCSTAGGQAAQEPVQHGHRRVHLSVPSLRHRARHLRPVVGAPPLLMSGATEPPPSRPTDKRPTPRRSPPK